MLHIIGGDPIHDRPPTATAEDLRHDVESLHGSLMRMGRTASNPQAAGAFHAATVLVANLLWPVSA